MDFFMRCSKRPPAERRPPWRAWLLVLLLLLSPAWADGIIHQAVSLSREKEMLVVDLLEKYQLTGVMREALQNGVPLTFITEVALRREGHWFWKSPLVDKRLKRVLLYHPLAGSYEVKDASTGKSRYFATLDAALVALGDIKAWRILPTSRLEPGKAYRVTIESWHDIDALPMPLRPRAYLTPSWRLSSKTWEWRLQP